MKNFKALAMVFLTGLGLAALPGGPATCEDPSLKSRKPNRLIHEKSPYLLQHAHNPVDWYPWGEEAFRAARERGKPIFLSIGYSTCHWCHVMERESFENETIAAFLNEHFISIKVDREERPDVDEVYMKALIAYSGSGGWPLSAFLTPEGKPFFLGSYFPPEDHPQRGNGFRALLEEASAAWRGRREKVIETAERLSAQLSRDGGPLAAGEPWSLEQLKSGTQEILATYDRAYGGFGHPPRYAPKFPRSSTLDFLLAYHRLAGEQEALQTAIETLKRMSKGGIRDHLGGGFHRYSTDRQWLVPHFEKMLYDNALLACTYLEAFRSTGEPLFLEVAREALEYLLRRLRDPAGGFCSAEDADSEGVEGKYYVFQRREILEALGEREGGLFISRFGVTEPGNFESAGENVLHQAVSLEELAAHEKKDLAAASASLEASRRKLLARREKRAPPLKDDKVLADWNGLAISAFSIAYQATGEERWLEAARAAAGFVLKTLQRDGKLLHRWRAGQADFPGYLEDYAFLANGLLDLQEASLDLESLREARRLAFEMVRQFWDDKNGGFFQTGPQHEQLLVRTKDFYDGAIPSGNAVAAAVLLRLAAYTEEPELVEKAGIMARIGAALFKQGAEAHPQMLAAAARGLLPRAQAVVAAPRLDAAALAPLREWNRGYLPNKRVVGVTPENRQETIKLCPWVGKVQIPERIEKPMIFN